MQYLVHTSGNVLDNKNKVYVVNANSEKEAQQIANANFYNDFNIIDSDDICIKSYNRIPKAIAAYIFMTIPIILSLIDWKNGHNSIIIAPDYISCLYSVLFYAAFIIRFKGIQRTVGSWIDILFCIFIILLLSSFIKTIMVSPNFNFFGIKEVAINTSILFPIIIILSWFGLKAISVICFAGTFILALFNISALSNAMGSVYGSAYIICAFMGILFYLSVEPVMLESLSSIKKSFYYALNHEKNDIMQAKKSINNIYSDIKNNNNINS